MNDNNFLTRYFPAPNFLDTPFVGIDISPLSIRMMEIIDHPTLKVGKNAECSLTKPFSLTEGDQKEVRDILKKWKKEYDLEYIKASLPEDKSYLFDTEIEFGTEEKMRSSIEFSLEENVPLSGADAIFDYRLVGESQKKGFVKVAVTVLPRDVVNKFITFFHECDLKPISFQNEAQALARSLVKRGDKGTYLVVNIRSSRTGLYVVSKGSIQFTSTIQIGSMDFTKAIQNTSGLSKEQAAEFKEKKGYVLGGQKELPVAFASTASAFRQEIEKVYVYWVKHRSSVDPTETIQKIILSGREALTLGFKEYINQTLKITIEVGNVWTNMPPFDEYISPIALAPSLNFAPAIGLALPEKE